MRRLLLAAVLAGAGCGGDERTRIWFSTEGESLRAVERELPQRPRSLVHALLAGPRPSERDEGVTTALPDLELVAVTLRDGIAHVRLRGEMRRYRPNTVTFALRLSQIVYTLSEHPRVRRVRIDVDGEPWALQRHDGSLVRDYTRETAPFVCNGHIWVLPPQERCR